jgi:hypothetical protein
VDQPTLFRFVALSILLHLWIVVLFGTSTYSGSRRDRDFGGAFDVSLRALIEERGSGFRQAPGADTAAPGTALLPHTGSTAPAPPRREIARPPDAAPPPTIAAPPPAAAEPAASAPPIAPPAAEPLQRLNLDAPEEVDKPYVPAAPASPIEREATPPAPPAQIAPREIAPPPAPIERIVPPQIERDTTPPVDTKPREVAVPPPAAETKPPDVAPPPVERIVTPVIERESAPAPETKPRAVPIAPAPAPERMPAPPVATPQPRVAPPEPVARPEPVAPSVQRDVAPPAAPAAAPATAPTPRSAPSEIAPRPAERIAPDKAPVTQPVPRSDASPPEPLPRLRFGAPEPDEDMFKPRRDAVTPPAEPGAAPRLDLDEAKKRAARAVVREGSGSRGLLPVIPPPPERDSKEARALEKAAKPDCRTAYANMGLLAAVPLVASAIGDSGCRW